MLGSFSKCTCSWVLSLKPKVFSRVGSGWFRPRDCVRQLLFARPLNTPLPLPTLSSPIYNNCRVGLPLNRICVAGAGNHLSKIAAHLCSQHTTVLLVRQPVCSICCAQFVQVAVCTVQYISTQCTLHYSTHCVQCSVYYTMCNVT